MSEPNLFRRAQRRARPLGRGARAVFGDNFVGAYIQGSFAVVDFTEWSYCDFIIVTARSLAAAELVRLQGLHAAIHELPYPYWRSRLESSNTLAAILRRWSTTPRHLPGEPHDEGWADPGLLGHPSGPTRFGTSITARERWCGPSTTTRTWSADASRRRA